MVLIRHFFQPDWIVHFNGEITAQQSLAVYSFLTIYKLNFLGNLHLVCSAGKSVSRTMYRLFHFHRFCSY